MNNVTDLINPDFAKDNFKLAREMVDFGMSVYHGMNNRNQEIQKRYRMYHGRYTAKEKSAITTVHGKISSTEFHPYRLAKVKIDQLLGESLEVGFTSEVDTISPVERANKKNEALKTAGRSMAKPFIEAVQKQGFKIYDGVRIPDYDKNMVLDMQEFRTKHELLCQRILDEKIKDTVLNNIYYYIFASNIFASEMFSRGCINEQGKTSIEVIQPERMIYPRNLYDQYGSTCPIVGHWWHGTFSEVVRRFNVAKDTKEWNELVTLFSGGLSSGGNQVLMTPDGMFDFENKMPDAGASSLYRTVYEFQWRYYVDKVSKEEVDGSFNMYELGSEEEKYLKDNNIPYKTLRFERIYQGAVVNGIVYLGYGDVKDYAVSRDNNGRIHANYDYTMTFVKTFGGIRTSFAEVVLDLNRQYDYSRWLLMREIRKAKSSAVYINKAYLGTRTRASILYDLEDEGVLEFKSNDKFDESNEGILDGKNVIGAVNAGASSTLIRDLISICLDLERVLDGITGMNDSRKGTEMATTTATTAQNNLQASRSVTYDMFHFTENHMERQLTQLIEKTKSAIYGGSREAYSYLGPDDIEYLEQSNDFFQDNFKARIVGGRRSQQIFAELSNIITGEVTSGKRSSKDFAEIKQSESLTEAIEILRLSDERLQAITQQSQQSDQQTKLQLSKQSIDAQKENREDTQAAEKELQESINATSIQNTTLKVQADLMKPQLESRIPPVQTPKNNKR